MHVIFTVPHPYPCLGIVSPISRLLVYMYLIDLTVTGKITRMILKRIIYARMMCDNKWN